MSVYNVAEMVCRCSLCPEPLQEFRVRVPRERLGYWASIGDGADLEVRCPRLHLLRWKDVCGTYAVDKDGYTVLPGHPEWIDAEILNPDKAHAMEIAADIICDLATDLDGICSRSNGTPEESAMRVTVAGRRLMELVPGGTPEAAVVEDGIRRLREIAALARGRRLFRSQLQPPVEPSRDAWGDSQGAALRDLIISARIAICATRHNKRPA